MPVAVSIFTLAIVVEVDILRRPLGKVPKRSSYEAFG